MQSDSSVPEALPGTESPSDCIQSSSSDHPPGDDTPTSAIPDDMYSQSVSSMLNSVIRLNPLPSPWITISTEPIILCKMKVHTHKQAEVDLTIRINNDMKWTLFVRSHEVDSKICPMLSNLPLCVENMESILLVVQKLNDCRLCVGNQDEKFIKLHKQRAVTHHGISGQELR